MFLEIDFCLGRHIDGLYEDAESKFAARHCIETWEYANDKFSKHVYELDNVLIKLSVDFSPIINHLIYNTRVAEEVRRTRSFDGNDNFDHNEVHVTFAMEIVGEKRENAAKNICYHFIEYYIYDLFLVMNLSSPGSFNIYAGYIQNKENMINISSNAFDVARLGRAADAWGPVEYIEFKKVIHWFGGIRGNQSLLPKSGSEKALFALLHIARADVGPIMLVWIFYALETLLDTKPGENLRYLHSRITLILGLDKKSSSILKQKLRKMYDVRSSIVHGGFEIIHPYQNELIDKDIKRVDAEIMRTCDDGFKIVLSVLQRMINMGIFRVGFEEKLVSK